MDWSVIILLTIITPVIIKWTCHRLWLWYIFWKIPGPPEWALPFIGHALMLRGDPDDFFEGFTTMTKERIMGSGKQIIATWFGSKPIVVVAGPDAVEVLLRSSKHTDKALFYDFLHPWLGTGLLTSKGAKWKERRRLLTPTFHFKILKDFLSVMNSQAKILNENLEKYSQDGKIVNMFSKVTLCTLDIICETAMGKSIKAQSDSDSEYIKAIYRTSELVQTRQKSPWIWPDFIYYRTESGRKFQNDLKVLHGFTRSVISDRLEKRKNQTNSNNDSDSNRKRRLAFLDLLINVSENESALSISDIQEEVDTFMFEGHDTTSSGLSFTLHQIGTHPDVQQKVQEELDEVFQDNPYRDVTMDDLQKMTYLERVIKEALRKLPPVPFIARSTTDDCRMDGYYLPKDTTCLVMIYSINNHPLFWKDPDKFDPDRFLPENIQNAHPYSHIAFSAGPRNCIGQKFAMMEEKVILSHVLRNYEVTSVDKLDQIRLMGDLILRPRDGINMTLKRRKI